MKEVSKKQERNRPPKDQISNLFNFIHGAVLLTEWPVTTDHSLHIVYHLGPRKTPDWYNFFNSIIDRGK